MNNKRDKKDDDDSSLGNVFSKMQKTTVLQEARIFNQTPVNPKKCALTLTKILYLLNQGEVLTTQEVILLLNFYYSLLLIFLFSFFFIYI